MKIVDAFIGELEREAETTKRVLARVPNEKMNWRPHPKSMSLGQLASHITRIPGGVAKMLAQPQFEGGPVNTPPPVPANASELVPNLEASVADAKAILNNFDDATMMTNWKMIRGGKKAFLRRAFVSCAPSCSTTGITIAANSRCICAYWMFRFPRSTVQVRMKTHLHSQ